MNNLDKYFTRQGWEEDWRETRPRVRKNLEALANIARKPYDLYKKNKYVNLNANVLAAAYPSIEAASIASDKLESAGWNDGSVAVGAGIIDWLAYIPVHIGLHYLSNKEKFIGEDGKFSKKYFWRDVAKVYRTQIPSIALFYAAAGPLHYGLMKIGFEADTANLLSYWGTLVATRTLHTYNYWKNEKSEININAENTRK